MVYDNDTPLTPEIIERIVPEIPDKALAYVSKRGFKVVLPTIAQNAYLAISPKGEASIEDEKHWLILTQNLKTLGRLRMLCAALEIPLDESALLEKP